MPQGSLVCRVRLARDHSMNERSAHSTSGLLRRRVNSASKTKSDPSGSVKYLPDARHVATFPTDKIESWIDPVDKYA